MTPPQVSSSLLFLSRPQSCLLTPTLRNIEMMVRMDRSLVTSPLPMSSVHACLTCERMCEGLYVDGERGCARVFLCVSVLEKADLRDLCSTFTLLLIHPFALTVVARLD